jgi:hypothetical protein
MPYDLSAPTHALGRVAPTTIDNTVGGVGITVPAGTVYAELYCETGQIRFTVDGTAPTTTVGRVANAGDTIEIALSDWTKFRAIRATGTSGSLQGDCWG